jgi:hypothetical protein
MHCESSSILMPTYVLWVLPMVRHSLLQIDPFGKTYFLLFFSDLLSSENAVLFLF